MKTTTSNKLISFAGLLVALPTSYIILVGVLKYGLSVDGPFDLIAPTMERWGIKDGFGFNISLVILFGPILGFLIAMSQVLIMKIDQKNDELRLELSIQFKWFPLLVAAFSLLLLGLLGIYLVGENCRC